MSIKAVIFDLDDTLFPERDYVISGFKACSHFLSADGLSNDDTVDMLIKLFDESPQNVFDRFINKQKLPSYLIAKCIDIYRNHNPILILREDVKAVLDWLKNNDFALGLLTDGRSMAQRGKISALNLELYMDSIVVTDELGGPEFRKPNPAGYMKIIDSLSISPKHMVYVGDNLAKDFIAPNSLGMISIYCENIKGLYALCNAPITGHPRYTIKTLTELKPLVMTQNLLY